MKQNNNMIQFWIHNDPKETNIRNEYWRSQTEPIFDMAQNIYILSPDAKADGDMFVYLNSSSKSLLPKDLLQQIKPGMKARVTLQGMYELKNCDDETIDSTDPKVNVDSQSFFQILPFNDKLIFAYNGVAKIHERKAVIYTHQNNPELPFREEYINEEGDVIKHDGDKGIYDYYTILGRSGDTISPKKVGDIWGNDTDTTDSLEDILQQAYNKGIRFTEPPKENVIDFTIKVLGNDIIEINCISDYYGFGQSLRFWTKRNFRSEPTLKTRSIERVIVNGIIGYRAFFNIPELKAKVNLIHDQRLESPDFWKTNEQFEEYFQQVEDFKNIKLPHLNNLIAESVETKWQKKIEISQYESVLKTV